jgi:hypothetical protein
MGVQQGLSQKNWRYAPSNGVFPRNERILFNDVTTRLKCKLQAQLQLAVIVGAWLTVHGWSSEHCQNLHYDKTA